MDLEEWTIAYVKYKHMNSLEDYEIAENSVRFNFEDREEEFFLEEELDSEVLETDSDSIVCLNDEENVEFLADNWEEVKDTEKKFIFVNLEANKKFVVKPKVHDKVAAEENLEEGLKSMQEQISE